MGKIGSQTIKGTIYSYLGIIVGFFSVTLLRSHGLTTEQNGILELITSYAMILVQLASLGIFSASSRCFPYFRDPNKNHHGFLFLISAIPVIGTVIFCLLYFIIQTLTPENPYTSFLNEWSGAIIVLTIANLVFNIFDTYNRNALFDAVTGATLKEFVLKITTALSMGLMLFFSLPFHLFLAIWLFANIIPSIIIFYKLKRNNQLDFHIDRKFLDKEKITMLASVSLFAVISGFTTMIIQYIDKIMIDGMINTSLTGIYGITAIFGTVVIMPSRIMYRIGSIVIAEKWKSNDLTGISSVYKKSCINQLLIGLLIFIGIWANIDNVFKMLPQNEGYEAGKYVIFFISLGGLIEMSTGLNGVLLATSKYYRYDTFFFVGLIVLTILANIIFIPLYGITGAAIASALTTLLFNLFRYLFIWQKFKIQPFGWNNLYILFIGIVILFLIGLLPSLDWFILDIIVRSGLITIFYVSTIYLLKIAPEMNKVIINSLTGIQNIIRK